MTFEEYQKQTDNTAKYPGVGTQNLEAISYVTIGLVGEAGEIANKVKKLIRDGDSPDKRQEIRAEIGDVLWYLARLCIELDTTLNGLAIWNLEKLKDRKSRDMISGSGDDR